MDIKELKAFQTVATELNFRKAAEILGMSQPPLTRLISNMETRLGVRLFHRTTRKVELTGEGIFLLNNAKDILEKLDTLDRDLRSLKKINRQSMTISLHHAAIHSDIPKLLSSFKLQFPGMKINLVNTSSTQIEKKLLLGELDLALGVQLPQSQQLSSLEINSHQLGLLISRENLLSRKSKIKLADLNNETLVFHGKEDHLGFQSEFAKFLRKMKINTSIYYKKHGESCPELAANDVGILITSKTMAKETGRTKFVPFADFSPRLKVYALWKRESMSGEQKALLSFLQEGNHTPSSDMDYHFN
ncbi:MAG: LysR family transcriptional regulator [Bdellovibrionota bacterium]